MGFSRQEYWYGLPCFPPGDLLDPGIRPASLTSPALRMDSLLLSHRGSPQPGLHVCSKLHQSCLTMRPNGLQPVRLLCPLDSPGTNTGVGCCVLLQGIFLTQESNLCLFCLPALVCGFFTTSATWEVHCQGYDPPIRAIVPKFVCTLKFPGDLLKLPKPKPHLR